MCASIAHPIGTAYTTVLQDPIGKEFVECQAYGQERAWSIGSFTNDETREDVTAIQEEPDHTVRKMRFGSRNPVPGGGAHNAPDVDLPCALFHLRLANCSMDCSPTRP